MENGQWPAVICSSGNCGSSTGVKVTVSSLSLVLSGGLPSPHPREPARLQSSRQLQRALVSEQLRADRLLRRRRGHAGHGDPPGLGGRGLGPGLHHGQLLPRRGQPPGRGGRGGGRRVQGGAGRGRAAGVPAAPGSPPAEVRGHRRREPRASSPLLPLPFAPRPAKRGQRR